MKKILLFILCFASLQSFAQIVNNGAGTFVWTNGAPSHNPSSSGAKFAVDRNTFKWYEWISGTSWTESGERVQFISGCAAPAYTPTIHQSKIVVNACTTPEMYIWSGSAWVMLGGGAVALEDLTDVDVTGVTAWSTLVFSDDVYKWVIDTNSIRHVADSTEFTQFFGNAKTVIMSDADRGGMFRPCTSCTADNYMVFTDANGQKWERFGYDRILASWWGNHGSVSLQTAIDYVGATGTTADSTIGVLVINQEITIREGVTLKEGVILKGVSFPNIDGSHVADTPAKNAILVDLDNPSRTAITWEDNGRAYNIGSGVDGVAFDVLTPCHAVLDIKEPYKGTLSNVYIAPNTSPRNFDYAIKVTGSVVCEWDRIHIQGAKIAGILTYDEDINGTTITITNSYITRCNIGILDTANVEFNLHNTKMENIDSIGVWTNNGLKWTDSYTENCPLATNGAGAFVYSDGDGEVYINNVKMNASNACSLETDCYLFSGGSRQTTISNGLAIGFGTVATTPAAFKFLNLENVLLSSTPMPDSAFLKNTQVRTVNLQLNSGGSLANGINYFNNDIRINNIIDKDGHTGGDGQILGKTSGGLDWLTLSTGNITGTLTTNNVPKATGANTIGSSQITDNGTSVAVNTASPSGKFVVTNSSTSYPTVRFTTPFGDWAANASDGFFKTFSAGLGIVAGSTGGLGLTDGAVIQTSGGFTRFYANNTNPIRLINNAVTATSGAHGVAQFYTNGFSPTSGNASYSIFEMGGNLNQGASATGIVRGGWVSATVAGNTSNWRSFEITPNVGKGVYQTGTSAVNNFAGKTAFGTTNTPLFPLEVHSTSGNTAAVQKLKTTTDSLYMFVASATPESTTTANMGSIAFGTDGNQYIKHSGTGNTGWLLVDKVIKGTAILDFPSTNNHESSDLTISVTGAAVGDPVSVAPPATAVSAHSLFNAWVSATNTVTVRFNHYGAAGATDPVSGTFNVIVHKY